uniref:Uncharacterized protein n=1 Tax=Ulva compressa TaxID=63659 RepID=A0A678ZWC1_ULVCO|nr:hypothetical protein [Ulva compressa]
MLYWLYEICAAYVKKGFTKFCLITEMLQQFVDQNKNIVYEKQTNSNLSHLPAIDEIVTQLNGAKSGLDYTQKGRLDIIVQYFETVDFTNIEKMQHLLPFLCFCPAKHLWLRAFCLCKSKGKERQKAKGKGTGKTCVDQYCLVIIKLHKAYTKLTQSLHRAV